MEPIIRLARDIFGTYSPITIKPENEKSPHLRAFLRADGGTRTPDPFITSEVLYQLSYVGIGRKLTCKTRGSWDAVASSDSLPARILHTRCTRSLSGGR